MALIIEDGTGKVDAESYLSVADADAYHSSHGDPADWSGQETAAKEAALRIATQYLDLVYGRRWIGVRANEAQALSWPRSEASDQDGYAIESTAIPRALREATAELALRHITEGEILPDATTERGVKKYRAKVGEIEEETEYIGTKAETKRFVKVEYLVRGLTASGYSVERS